MKVTVVIPCYKVRRQILKVLTAISPEVDSILVVDDGCPEESGDFVRRTTKDPRTRVLHHRENSGVGAALVTGYREALRDGTDIVVKVDGDAQMDPALIPGLISPIESG